jgi:hypothetical protein
MKISARAAHGQRFVVSHSYLVRQLPKRVRRGLSRSGAAPGSEASSIPSWTFVDSYSSGINSA